MIRTVLPIRHAATQSAGANPLGGGGNPLGGRRRQADPPPRRPIPSIRWRGN